jgi:hypothetical protein
VADIDRIDPGRAMGQEDIGETAGRGPNVQADSSGGG